jgi:MFS family permease
VHGSHRVTLPGGQWPTLGLLRDESGQPGHAIADPLVRGGPLRWFADAGEQRLLADFLLYGTSAALVFNTVFFPELDTTAGTIASFGTLAAGYFARPLGGVLFGHFGDRAGRKRMLVNTILLMGVSSTCIGIAAPALLVLLRLPQGVATGGEWAARR